MVVYADDSYRANDEVSYAREQLQRTLSFAEGSGAVFAPQVETYEINPTWVFVQNPVLILGISVCGRRRGPVNSRRFSDGLFRVKHVPFFTFI